MRNISQKIAQQIVETVKDVCGQDINYIDLDGKIYASTNKARIGKFHEIGKQVALTGETIEVMDDNSFFGTYAGVNIPVLHEGERIGVIGISGSPEKVRKFAYLAEKITLLLLREQELNYQSYTKKNQINYIIRLLIREEASRQKQVTNYIETQNIDTGCLYQVILIKLDSRYNSGNLTLIENKIFQTFQYFHSSLYTFNYPNEYILILESRKLESYYYLLEKLLENHKELLKIAIGSPHPLYSQHLSYDEAKIASRSSKTGSLSSYQHLGLEILCAHTDKEIREHYEKKFLDSLDAKEIELLKVYYENEMSLSQTSEQLFLHKNTIQYQLDRIYEKTGFNPRRFRDAAGLYSALLLQKLSV